MSFQSSVFVAIMLCMLGSGCVGFEDLESKCFRDGRVSIDESDYWPTAKRQISEILVPYSPGSIKINVDGSISTDGFVMSKNLRKRNMSEDTGEFLKDRYIVYRKLDVGRQRTAVINSFTVYEWGFDHNPSKDCFEIEGWFENL